MRYQATPFTEKDDVPADLEAILHGRAAPLGLESYDERLTVPVEAATPQRALSRVYSRFQNLDEDYVTPDDLRSMRKSDLIRLVDAAGTTTWWMCTSDSWILIAAPAAELRAAA